MFEEEGAAPLCSALRAMPGRPRVIDPTTPLLRERIRRVFQNLPAALAGDEEAIHEMRVGARRLRVALPLLGTRPEGRRVRRARRVLRQLSRTAGQSRDLDVAVGLLEEAVGRPGSAEERVLLKRLRAARQRSRRSMAEALFDLEIARLRRDLRTVVRRRAEPVFTVSLRMRDARESRGGQALALLQSLGERFDPLALHTYRRRVRRLRYVGELAEVLRSQPSEAPAIFKDLQDRLGRVHDLYVVSQWLAQQADHAEKRGHADLAAAARRLAATFLERSQEEHRAFLAVDPAEALRRGLEAIVPVRSVA
jgi:CHAD domain-containing protein